MPVGEIADRVGVNKAQVYEHFASKDELFLAVARRARDQLISFIGDRTVARGPAEPTRERIRSRYHAFLDFAVEEPDAMAVLAIPEAVVALDGAGGDVVATGLREVIARDLASTGLPTDQLPDVLAAMFVGMAGSVMRRGARSTWDFEAVVDLLTDFTIAGMVGVDRATLERADRPRPTTPPTRR